MDLQMCSLHGVIFTICRLKIIMQVVSAQGAFQASTNHFLKDVKYLKVSLIVDAFPIKKLSNVFAKSLSEDNLEERFLLSVLSFPLFFLKKSF